MNEIQSVGRGLPRWRQRTVSAPPEEVLRRLPAPAGGSPGLHIAPPTPGTLVPTSRRHAVERDGIVVAWVEVTAVSPSVTLLEVATDEPDGQAITERLEVAACGPPSPERRCADGRSQRRQRTARAVAVAGVLALVAGSAAAYRLLAPPEPLAVEQAVAQFQQAPAPAVPVTQTGPSQSARSSDRGGGAPGARVEGRRPRPAPADATGQPSNRVPRAAVPPEPRGTGHRRDTETQPRRPRDTAARPAALPAPGVYTYATSGHEEIDQPNDRHDYPAETALTVHHTGCGVTTRWQPLEQRWDEMEICAGEVPTLARMTTQREFYGQRQRSDYRCEPGSRAWHTDAGAAWTTRCSDDASTVTTRFKVVGREPVAVGGETVRAVHLRLRATVTGGTRGHWIADRWLHPDTGLLLRLQGSTDATSTTPFGDVRYREQVRLDLQSLEPRR